MPENRFVVRIACLTLALVAALPLLADEGLWPYNQFPADALKQKRDFTAPPGFLDQLRLSSSWQTVSRQFVARDDDQQSYLGLWVGGKPGSVEVRRWSISAVPHRALTSQQEGPHE